MAWTPSIAWIAPDRLTVAVAFTDGTRREVRRFDTNGTLASLKPQVRSVVARLDAADVATDLVEGASVDVTPDVVVPPDPPTAQELLERDFRQKYRKYQQLQAAVALGVIAANAAAVTTATSEAQAAFRPAFVEFL